MQKSNKLEQIQVFFEIAMSIGTSLDIKPMLKTALMTYLRKLNCSSGAILSLKKTNSVHYYKNLISIPYKSEFSKEFAEINKLIPYNTDAKSVNDFLANLPLEKHFSEDNHFYVMNLPEFGLICLKKNGDELAQNIIFTLQTLNKKLAQACIACSKNQDLVTAKEKAEASDKLKSVFIENISHEIRTPLNAILGYSTLIADENISEKMLIPACRTISDSSKSLLSMMEDLLDISLLKSGNLVPRYTLCNVNQILLDQEKIFNKHLKRENKSNLTLQIVSPADDLFIVTDSVRLCQILDYLISNAVRFTEDDEKGKVEIGYTKQDSNTIEAHPSQLVFYIKDTGIGIPENKQTEIFDPFNRILDSKDKLYGGTGIGLTIAKHLVLLLQGEIWLESVPCEGSTFHFSIPTNRSLTTLTNKL